MESDTSRAKGDEEKRTESTYIVYIIDPSKPTMRSRTESQTAGGCGRREPKGVARGDACVYEAADEPSDQKVSYLREMTILMMGVQRNGGRRMG
jgi:hypothetical protein